MIAFTLILVGVLAIVIVIQIETSGSMGRQIIAQQIKIDQLVAENSEMKTRLYNLEVKKFQESILQ